MSGASPETERTSSATRSAAAALSVLHLNSLLNGGGTDDQCVKLVHGLQQLGAHVRLLGPDHCPLLPTIRKMGLPFHTLSAEGPLKARFITVAARLIRHHHIQIVHGHHGRDLWPTVLAARLSGRKPRIVLTRHMAKSPSSWFSRRFLLTQCDALIAVSHFVEKVLREGVYEPTSSEPERRNRPPMAGDHSKIHVVHGGVDTERFRPFDASAQRRAWHLEPGHYAFGVVGGYDLPRGKGQREFLKAAARISSQVPNARFLVVGRGNLGAVLERDIAQCGLQGKAWLTPYCEDMPAAMNALDCLVLPQVGTEAFALVVLEAFACGKSVIASALDGIPESFSMGGQGQLVTPEDITQLAEAMLTWAKRGPLIEEQRWALHEKIEQSGSLQKASRATLQLYRNL